MPITNTLTAAHDPAYDPNLASRPLPCRRAIPRLLVAEDDSELRGMVSQALQAAGCEVVDAAHGEQVLDVLGSLMLVDPCPEPVDLIVSDIRMPGTLSGLDLLAALRRSGWTMPVLLMTAYPDPVTRDEAARLGAQLFDKPLRIGELCAEALRLVSPRF